MRISWTAFVIILALKVLVLIQLYWLFGRTMVDRQYPHYVRVPAGSSRAIELMKAQEDFLHRLAPADGQFYRQTAEEGYDFDHGRGSPFFPLFPLIVAGAASVWKDPVGCGVVLNFLFSLGGLLVLARLLTRIDRPVVPPLVLMLAFPFSGFYNLFLTESLFLLLSASCIYLAREKRLAWSALLGFLAGLTRPQGLLLSVPLLIEVVPRLRKPGGSMRTRSAVLVLALAPLLGMASFFLYTGFHTGSLLSVIEAQADWGREVGSEGIRKLFTPARFPTDVLGATFGIALIPFLFRRLPLTLAAYGAAMALFPLVTGSLLSYSRFITTSFPHFFCLSAILERRPVFWFAVTAFFFLFQSQLNRELMSWVFFG